MTFLGALSILLIALKLTGVITISWFIAFLPIIILIAFWVFIFIVNIILVVFINKKMEKDMKRFDHDKRFNEIDEKFQKAKAEWETKFGK